MKTLFVSSGLLFFSVLLNSSCLAQRAMSRPTDYMATTTLRVGVQGVRLGELNQALQRAGYQALPSQMPMLSLASQFSRPNRPLAFHAEVGMSVGNAISSANGLYKAQAGFYYAKLGGSYRIIRTDKFELAPQLSVVSLPFRLQVTPASSGSPSLNTVLTNPGSAQTATFRAGTVGIDAGFLANFYVPYGTQQQYDCFVSDRYLVVGLDAGYRVTSRSPFNNSYDISSTNPAIQLSGWYAGLHLGLGRHVRSTAAVTR